MCGAQRSLFPLHSISNYVPLIFSFFHKFLYAPLNLVTFLDILIKRYSLYAYFGLYAYFVEFRSCIITQYLFRTKNC